MSLDYLEDLAQQIDGGRSWYACQGVHQGEFHLSQDANSLKPLAQRSANAKKFEVNVYRLINKMDTVAGDSYFLCKKILEPGPRGEPHLQWLIVDTRDAAEMLRDVSQGTSPYFGATIEFVVRPSS